MTGLKIPTVITIVTMFVGGSLGGVAYVEKAKECAKEFTVEEIKKTDRYYQLQFENLKQKITDIDSNVKDIRSILIKGK